MQSYPNETNVGYGHRLHLKALANQEQNRAYRRRDYLSHEWQMRLWKEAVKDVNSQVQSPKTIFIPTSSCCAPEAPSEICVRWREKIIEWKYQVVDRFDLERDIVCISTFYLDQYLCMNYVDHEDFRLVAMSSLYLAIKLHSPHTVPVESIASAGNGLITIKHIQEMELSIMKCLDWHLHPPTSAVFIEHFFPLISSNYSSDKGFCSSSTMLYSYEFSRFLAELSVCAYPFLSAKPSSIAIAAILYSFEFLDLPGEAREVFQALAKEVCSIDVNGAEVEACGKLLRRVYKLAVPDSNSPLGR